MIGGGPEGGIHKTTNAGKTWTKLTKRPAHRATWAARASPSTGARARRRVFALIDAKRAESGFYRSDDGGAPGRAGPDAGGGRRARGGPGRRVAGAAAQPPNAPAGGQRGAAAQAQAAVAGGQRGGAQVPAARPTTGIEAAARPYYHEIFVDPYRPDTLYSMNMNVERSTDGGKTWHRTNWENHGVHVDHHAIAFDPTDQNHILLGNDGGLYETVRRRRDLAFLRQPAHHAVLPRRRRQREAVLQRLRRHAGQLVALRPVAHPQPLGRPQQRLVHHRRRRRLPGARSTRTTRTSSTRSRRTANVSASRPAHGRLEVHPSAAGARERGARRGRRAGRRTAAAQGRTARAGRAARGARPAAAQRSGRAPIAPTGTRPTSSARTRRRGSTGRATACIAATTAATPGP